MNELILKPLTADAFAAYGTVFAPPADGRTYFDGALASLRPAARPSLSVATKTEAASLPLAVRQMERHEFSSQTFVPLQPSRILVLVAPHADAGGPDMSRAEAFVTDGLTGFTFGANVWHHPLTVLSAPGSFSIFMWIDGTTGDEEFVDVEPMLLKAPA
ncbi:hypothetical protein DLJ53_13665 [Acuticoccus sediminis]|uniref:Ureidoglycolate lyase n=1 Tax=Acuticoccus sediminis TaxID=2184697 RepID=A0A8B2NX64_9HYPH|nr:ureidoglycolate lyase [Acuticoccus sediminis]RAI02403.1 hypothetical protein DLJ53_13665 [Acuticoccus sediminis]